MKLYIFITYGITGVGGGQCYVAAKAKYLEREGWRVVVFSEGCAKSKNVCPIDYLNKYKPYMMPELGIPLFKLPQWMVDFVLRRLVKLVGKTDSENEIIIESHDDKTALWGELLAKRLNARHFFFTLNELFRGEDKCYEKKIDFYLFKYKRNELLSSAMTLNRLFEGYLTVKESDVEYVWIDEDPVQDVKSDIVDRLEKYDYNICYIGRAVKPYVPNIIKGVGDFAANNKEKTIQFIIVGDASSQKDRLESIESLNENLIITELGSLHPLPQTLFSKVDVVIAGSGSARCSVEEGALTIIADPESKQALGILGYDTNNSIYKDDDSVMTSFSEALDRVLIDKVYLQMPFKYPKKTGVAGCTEQNFRLFEKADKKKAYYDEDILKKGCKDYKLSFDLLVQKMKSYML